MGGISRMRRTEALLIVLFTGCVSTALKGPTIWRTEVLAVGSTYEKESLDQSDVMEAVLMNKPAMAICAKEQHMREPSVGGIVRMHWTILNSGEVGQTQCLTQEFQDTYFASCVSTVISKIKFPAYRESKIREMMMPFKF
jgi:hypothetical protein